MSETKAHHDPTMADADVQASLIMAQHALGQEQARVARLQQELAGLTRLLAAAQTDRAEQDRLQLLARGQGQQIETMIAEIAGLSRLLLSSEAEARQTQLLQAETIQWQRGLIGVLMEGPDGSGLAPEMLQHCARRMAEAGILDGPWYLAVNSDVADSEADPALHFLQYGLGEGRWPRPLPSAPDAHLAPDDAPYDDPDDAPYDE